MGGLTDTAAALAVSEGLDRVTAKSVASVLGVFPGLVTHYFATADEQAATRATLDYTAVQRMVISTAETLLGLKPGTLASSGRPGGPG